MWHAELNWTYIIMPPLLTNTLFQNRTFSCILFSFILASACIASRFSSIWLQLSCIEPLYNIMLFKICRTSSTLKCHIKTVKPLSSHSAMYHFSELYSAQWPIEISRNYLSSTGALRHRRNRILCLCAIHSAVDTKTLVSTLDLEITPGHCLSCTISWQPQTTPRDMMV